MNRDYEYYAKKFMSERPIQTFFLGLGQEFGEFQYGRFSKYKDNPELGGKLSVVPNESGTHLISFTIYITIMCSLAYNMTSGKYPYVYSILFFGLVIFFHLIYMYCLLSLPCVKHKETTKNYNLSKFVCFIGLAVPLLFLMGSIDLYNDYTKFVPDYNIGNKYSEAVLRKVYWRKFLSPEAQLERENKTIDEVNSLMGILNEKK